MRGTKDESWRHWVDLYELLQGDHVHRGPTVRDFLSECPSQASRVAAAALSVAKWHPSRPLNERGKGGYRSCGWCACLGVYDWTRTTRCRGCPVAVRMRGRCAEEETIYWAWSLAFRRSTKGEMEALTDKMYNILYDIYIDEYIKYQMGAGGEA